MVYLNNYFDFHVGLSFRVSVRRLCVRKLAPIPAVVSQNVTNKSCLVCVISEKYALLVTLSDHSQTVAAKEANFKNSSLNS